VFMISRIHSFLLHFAKTIGLNKLGFLKKWYFRFGNTQIPFFIKLQGIWMQGALIRFYLKGAHEPGVTKLAHQILKPGMTAVDLGALFGYYTFIFAKLVGENGRVYSFEPVWENYRRIENGIKKNGFHNITFIPKAVSDENGIASFFLAAKDAGVHSLYEVQGGGEWQEVATGRLDDILAEHITPIDFIKMDIEGAELKALRGMPRIIRENPNLKMAVELHRNIDKLPDTSMRQLLGELRSHGFRIHAISDHTAPHDVSLPLTDEELIALAKKYAHINMFCER
jgi:FkbM family methyltransferase